jgi:hypothetical protein
MQYALLIYNDGDVAEPARGAIAPAIAAVLTRPEVTGWIRLGATGSATTVRPSEGGTLLTDGPFVDSKEFLAGLVLIEADNLDGALAIADELQESRPSRTGAIEVRPIFDASGT